MGKKKDNTSHEMPDNTKVNLNISD